MAWNAVSSGAGGRINEDAVVVFEHQGVTDIVILDGATSVAGQQYIDREQGDVAWFVRRFGAAFRDALSRQASQEQTVRSALEATRVAFRERTDGQAVPLYAWPIAAMSWIRILPARGGADLLLYCLGDCKVLLRHADGSVEDLDPFVNPQEAVLQDAIAALVQAGVGDPAERRERLLPMLRRRREEQNAQVSPSVLCLAPEGPFAARRYNARVAPGAQLLAMTDGFYRLVQPYGLYSDGGLLHACARHGLDVLLEQLRSFEAAQADRHAQSGVALKSADDATAVAWTLEAVSSSSLLSRMGAQMEFAEQQALVEGYLAAYNAFDIEGMLAAQGDLDRRSGRRRREN